MIFGSQVSVGSQVSFRIVQYHGEKRYFRRFYVGRLGRSPPSGSAPDLQLVAIHKEKVPSMIAPATASEFSNFSKYVFLALPCKCISLWLTSKSPGK